MKTLMSLALAALLLSLPLSVESAENGDQPADGVKLPTSPAEEKAISQLRELGVLVLEVAQNDNRLDLGFHLTSESEIKDEHLAPLKDIQRARTVNLRGTGVTDAGLVHLKDLPHLERLHLEKTKITDEGLKHLQGLDSLKYLNLYGTAVTDAGLEELKGLKNLEQLYLFQTKVTDAGVDKLQKALPEVKVVR